MPRLTCPYCQIKMRADANRAGKDVICPGCGKRFTVDQLPNWLAAPPPKRREEEEPTEGIETDPVEELAETSVGPSMKPLSVLLAMSVMLTAMTFSGCCFSSLYQGSFTRSDLELRRMNVGPGNEISGVALSDLGNVVFGIAFPLCYLVSCALMAAWVMQDATSRRVQGAGVWAFLVLLSNVVGLAAYILSRRAGT